ncbi:ABC transporter ATP-binding protein [Desulfobulbus rhabdoformis]|uniref:ABC transporter ATP-binding protein n=1 Tax=Desulfobulbus rhabdoformis TaxID=34032 RepID=UPI0019658301|nr:ABC transporter ATP-binding protein [Desulfobulbus rhabdoformis]MBM9614409.1 ABC transporter ATP-binding protein [Desulfobulbus rhabdoformis]
MTTVIRVENLGKKYTLHHQQRESYTALRDVLASGISSIGQSLLHPFQKSLPDRQIKEQFWALKDISFEVKEGDRIGIIGRNGAGKSTLLKILSRITEPTSGRVKIKGRVASLLEVGTGFHPELTGRENIFLNGAILGMSRSEIKKKFDEIVDFAEIEKFLDTPVKRYSSGMYVRLAFAVAAHLEPEILIVDEVLAVGDAQFQKKCLGKMGEVAQGGRTVLFVSHQMAAIQNLCDRVLVLNSGKIQLIAETKVAINSYLSTMSVEDTDNNLEYMKRSGNGLVRLASFHMENEKGVYIKSICSGDSLLLVFTCLSTIQLSIKNVSIGFSIHNSLGDTLSVFYSHYANVLFDFDSDGVIKCKIDDFPFSPGQYHIAARVLADGAEADWPKGFIGRIDVEAGDYYKSGKYGDAGVGPVLIRGCWSLS